MRLAFRHLLPTLVVLSTTGAAQVFGPSGNEFAVNTTTVGDQYFSNVAVDAQGRYFVVWMGPDGDQAGVFGRRFTPNGSPIDATEFLVTAGTAGFQGIPNVGGAGSGKFVAVWNKSANGNEGIYAQRYDALLEAGGVVTVRSPFTTSFEVWPAVALDSSGNAVVVWNEGTVVNGQLYDAAGGEIGGTFQVSQTDAGLYARPSVARTSSGEFMVVWPAGYTTIMARRYSSGGVAVGGEFQVNGLTGSLSFARVATNGSGFVVAWARAATDYNIKAKRYDGAFQPIGGEFRVNTATTGGQYRPALGMDEGGGFVVAWNRSTSAGYSIVAQRFSSSGALLGGEVRVTPDRNLPNAAPSLAMRANGDFLVAWTRDLGGTAQDDIRAHGFCHALAGNANGDGVIDLADVFYLINNLFAGGPPPVQSGDADGSGTVELADVFYLINYLFAEGPAPACPSAL
jgi:hypothetical protein